jgi:hypothetical protein
MAGSMVPVLYVTDGGIQLAINVDESNVEAVNGASAARPPLGAAMIGSASLCRGARYRNAATGLSRVVPVLTAAGLAALPAVVNFLVASSGSAAAAAAFTLVGTVGENIRRSAGDTGLLDGDPT